MASRRWDNRWDMAKRRPANQLSDPAVVRRAAERVAEESRAAQRVLASRDQLFRGDIQKVVVERLRALYDHDLRAYLVDDHRQLAPLFTEAGPEGQRPQQGYLRAEQYARPGTRADVKLAKAAVEACDDLLDVVGSLKRGRRYSAVDMRDAVGLTLAAFLPWLVADGQVDVDLSNLRRLRAGLKLHIHLVPSLKTLRDVVEDYVRVWQHRQGREGRWLARQPSIEAAIKTAAMAVSPSGKRLNHQRRIPLEVLRAWTRSILRRKARIAQARRFSALYDLLNEAATDLYGIGPLTVYDTAVRIGAFLRLTPDYVYLHAGTRDGAKALGVGRGERLKRSELPAAFHCLSPGDIEDCLCIYKRQIKSVMQRNTAAAPRGRGCLLNGPC